MHPQNHRQAAWGIEVRGKLGKLGGELEVGRSELPANHLRWPGTQCGCVPPRYVLSGCPDSLLRATACWERAGACFIITLSSHALSLIALSRRTSHQTVPAIAAFSCQPPPPTRQPAPTNNSGLLAPLPAAFPKGHRFELQGCIDPVAGSIVYF